MSSYAIFRLVVLRDQRAFGGGNYYCNIAEMALLETGDVPTSLVGATFADSGHFNGSSNDAAKAFDLNNGTCWSGDMNALAYPDESTARYLEVTLAAPADIKKLSLRSFSDTSAPANFELWGWNGSGWDGLVGVDGETWASNTTKTYAFDPNTSTGRVSRVDAEVMRDGAALGRVSTVGAQVMRDGPRSALVSTVWPQVLRDGPRSAQVSCVAIQVMRSVAFTASSRRRLFVNN